MINRVRERVRALTVAGLMSGTSADGIDIALVRIGPKRRGLQLQLLAHRGFPFSPALRERVLAAQDARRTTTAELARLHWRLGLAYAKAYQRMRSLHGEPVDLVGCHGQTIYHQAQPERYAGERFRCTWQIGEVAPLAQVAGVPVVSNFRPADMVVGGQGAPLVPLLDAALYRDARKTRVLQNIGGIGNLTAVPPRRSLGATVAFDTGPGNMVLDALMTELFGKPYDRDGRTAARGRVLQPVVDAVLGRPFFAQAPPRAGGREQFGSRFTAGFLRACRRHSQAPEDAIATATALTTQSIALALSRFVMPALAGSALELIISGGGARNTTLISTLRSLVSPAVVLLSSDPSLPTPMPVEAKEAAAFALLAYMSWHGRPANVPSATGAREAVVLGEVTCA